MFFGLEAVFYWPKFFYIFLIFGAIGIAIILKQIFKPGRKQNPLINRSFGYFLILLMFFFFGVVTSLLFIKHGILFYIIAVFSSILIFGFFHTLNKNFKTLKAIILKSKKETSIESAQHEKLSEDNFSLKIIFFNIASLFFATSSIFGFIIFFRIPFWNTIPPFFLMSIFFIIQIFSLKGERVFLYDKRVLIIGLLLAQFFVILNYLPITFFTGGLFITVFYGLNLMFISKDFQEYKGGRLRLYQVLIGGAILLISLLTLRI